MNVKSVTGIPESQYNEVLLSKCCQSLYMKIKDILKVKLEEKKYNEVVEEINKKIKKRLEMNISKNISKLIKGVTKHSRNVKSNISGLNFSKKRGNQTKQNKQDSSSADFSLNLNTFHKSTQKTKELKPTESTANQLVNIKEPLVVKKVKKITPSVIKERTSMKVSYIGNLRKPTKLNSKEKVHHSLSLIKGNKNLIKSRNYKNSIYCKKSNWTKATQAKINYSPMNRKQGSSIKYDILNRSNEELKEILTKSIAPNVSKNFDLSMKSKKIHENPSFSDPSNISILNSKVSPSFNSTLINPISHNSTILNANSELIETSTVKYGINTINKNQIEGEYKHLFDFYPESNVSKTSFKVTDNSGEDIQNVNFIKFPNEISFEEIENKFKDMLFKKDK